jgi:hypothetical protein
MANAVLMAKVNSKQEDRFQISNESQNGALCEFKISVGILASTNIRTADLFSSDNLAQDSSPKKILSFDSPISSSLGVGGQQPNIVITKSHFLIS